MSVTTFPGNGLSQWTGANPYGGQPVGNSLGFMSTSIGPPGQFQQQLPVLPSLSSQFNQRPPSPNYGRPPSPMLGRSPSPILGRAPSSMLGRAPSPILGRAPSPFAARPPSPIAGQMLPRIPSTIAPAPFPQPFGPTRRTKTRDQKLDSVTRSRNALIIATIVVSAGFLACFITLLVMTYPPPSLQNFNMQVISTRHDFTYQATDLTNSNNYAFKVMETTMCSQVIGSASRAATIKSCKVTKFQDGSPGVKAYVLINISLDGKSPTELVQGIGEAIIRTAATDSDWTVGTNDISVVTAGTP